MRKYILGSDCAYKCESVTNGTQTKYERNGRFYKVDKCGKEGLVEHLVYLVLKNSTLDKAYIIPYDFCLINGRTGCVSPTFVGDSNIFKSANSIFTIETGSTDLGNYLWSIGSVSDRYAYIVRLLNKASGGLIDCSFYLKSMLYLDMLTLNTDRHAHNYGIILNKHTGQVSVAPLFDNGLALDTTRRGVADCCSCTISGSFEQQVIATGYPLKSPFKIRYSSLLRELDAFERTNGSYRETAMLRSQLNKYRQLFELK